MPLGCVDMLEGCLVCSGYHRLEKPSFSEKLGFFALFLNMNQVIFASLDLLRPL